MFFEVPDWDVGQPAVARKKAKRPAKQSQDEAPVTLTDPLKPQVTAVKNSQKMVSDEKKNRLANLTAKAPAPSVKAPASPAKKLAPPAKASAPSVQVKKALNKLSGARFRYLNQKLYESDSKQALAYFQEHPDDFAHYHYGFREQTKAWPVNPVDIFVERLQELSARHKKPQQPITVADLGCGDAKLAVSLASDAHVAVHSFDLVAVNEHVTVASMTDVPLKSDSVDLVIFSLSLMNTDYIEAVREAHRLLRDNGQLWIAEVSSRMEGPKGVRDFVDALKSEGFVIEKVDQSNPVFGLFYGRKGKQQQQSQQKSNSKSQRGPSKARRPPVLKSCLYKKR